MLSICKYILFQPHSARFLMKKKPWILEKTKSMWRAPQYVRNWDSLIPKFNLDHISWFFNYINFFYLIHQSVYHLPSLIPHTICLTNKIIPTKSNGCIFGKETEVLVKYIKDFKYILFLIWMVSTWALMFFFYFICLEYVIRNLNINKIFLKPPIF